jgi:hypothetical protein
MNLVVIGEGRLTVQRQPTSQIIPTEGFSTANIRQQQTYSAQFVTSQSLPSETPAPAEQPLVLALLRRNYLVYNPCLSLKYKAKESSSGGNTSASRYHLPATHSRRGLFGELASPPDGAVEDIRALGCHFQEHQPLANQP